jgi:hypothetical protein
MSINFHDGFYYWICSILMTDSIVWDGRKWYNLVVELYAPASRRRQAWVFYSGRVSTPVLILLPHLTFFLKQFNIEPLFTLIG